VISQREIERTRRGLFQCCVRCEDCNWNRNGWYYDLFSEPERAAYQHVGETGHRVFIERREVYAVQVRKSEEEELKP